MKQAIVVYWYVMLLSFNSCPELIWIKVSSWWQIPPEHQSTYLRPESASNEIPLSDPNLLCKSTSKCEHCETRFTSWKTVFEKFMKWGLKGGFQLMQILGLLVMYFDAVVVEVKTFFYFYSGSLWPYCPLQDWHIVFMTLFHQLTISRIPNCLHI